MDRRSFLRLSGLSRLALVPAMPAGAEQRPTTIVCTIDARGPDAAALQRLEHKMRATILQTIERRERRRTR